MRRALWLGFCGTFAAALVFAQGTQLTFEVASVKPSPPIPPAGGAFFGPPRGGPGTPDPGRIIWTYATLKNLLMTAYDVKAYQVTGPSWLDSERYDVAVKIPEGATKEQTGLMWQNLLAERFGVKLHHESKEFQVEELVIGKNGPKLKESEEDSNAPPPTGPPQMKGRELIGPGMVNMILLDANGPNATTMAKAQPLSKLTEMLSNQRRHPVVDKTGLTGKYDFRLEYTFDLSGLPLPPGAAPPPKPAAGAASDPGTDLAAAIQQQLGLRLVPGKAHLDVLVIETAEKTPTEN